MTANFPELDPLDELAPGLRGYTVEIGNDIYIPVLMADQPGQGALTSYLDKLEASGKTVKIPTVLSDHLAAYLKRRGYKPIWEESELGPVEVWTKEAL